MNRSTRWEGSVIKNGVVLIKDGKIERVGTAINIPSNYKVIESKVVTPGLIDARTVVGLAGYLNQPHDQMQLERSSAMQPELRAIDSYDARERLIEWIRGLGVTTINTGHAPASLISGQMMIAKTTGNNVDEATVVPYSMLAATLGDRAKPLWRKRAGNVCQASGNAPRHVNQGSELRS